MTRTLTCLIALTCCLASARADEIYSSPQAVAYTPDGKTLIVADDTGKSLALLPVGPKGLNATKARKITLPGRPTALALTSNGNRAMVALHGAGIVAEVDLRKAKTTRTLPVGKYPTDVAIAAKTKLLLTTNSGLGTLSIVSLETGKSVARIDVGPWPSAVAITPDETLAIVGNLLSAGPSDRADAAGHVSVVDLKTLKRVKTFTLPAGSSQVRDIVVSLDGKWAYITHLLGRTNLPTTQLERGWVCTNAVTVVDVVKRASYATVLLDSPSQGAANPWTMAVTRDGKTLWASLAGIHQVARVDLTGMHAMLARLTPAKRPAICNDLAALYRTGLIKRIDVGQLGPRGIALCPDETTLAIGAYFSGSIVTLDAATAKPQAPLALGNKREMTPIRRGYMLFYDARMCFQNWLSCVSCHPDARADGLNWDLLNDGIGNAKNSKSLLWSHRTPPVMSTGVRDKAETAVRSGIRYIQFAQRPDADAQAVDAWLKSLEPLASPHLVDGKLSDSAKRGKIVFEDKRVGCAKCHPAPLYTNLKSFDVGTQGRSDRTGKFDTPTLVEMWRSGPYLHDGSAATLKDVLTTKNESDKHGKTSHLSKQQLADLVAYLLSL